MKNAKTEFSQLDKEWVELMLEAQKTNISLEEIRKYLHSHKKSSQHIQAARSHTVNPF
ncbi:anti-repressor SinI family protein [Bacillus sp. YC2]|uniref:anti-repressor SinI n=1 Tax=Bacillus sp. YC2 TaxID=2861287 RepID=UPI001CA6895E|nr:anti-repressor SinI family protein [Bacillus sp. YC2]MBY8912991.1 anti-repressor SinI family protein [Bacillus sp. YC2]